MSTTRSFSPPYALACLIPLVLAPSVLVGSAAAADWPGWRGAERDAVVEDFQPPRTWSAKVRRLWTVEVGEGHACPVVSQGKIYQFSRLNDLETISCFNFSGGLVWRKKYPAPYTMSPVARGHGKGPKSTPIIEDGRICTLGISGILGCWSAEDGEMHWRHDFSKQFQSTSPLYGAAMSPIAVEGLMVAHVGGHGDGALCGFDARTGDVRWSWSVEGPAYTSPIVTQLCGVEQLVTQSQDMSLGITAAGKLLWSFPYKTPYTQNIMTPVICEGLVIVSGRKSGVSAYRVTKAGSGMSTEQVWHNNDVSMYMSSPLLVGRRLYGFSEYRSGQLFRLDATTGKLAWRGPGRQGDNAALLKAGDVFLALTTEAELLFFRDDADEYSELARWRVADTPTWAHPVVLGRRVLIKDLNHLSMWTWDEGG